MNNVILSGRLTRDPQVKESQGGVPFANFSIAVDNPFKKDEADFINCVCFKKTAEVVGKYFKKGSKIGVAGRMQMVKYTQNGEDRTTYQVVVDVVEMMDSKKQDDPKPQDAAKVEEVAEEDFPF